MRPPNPPPRAAEINPFAPVPAADDLGWAAFNYLTDALTPEEAAAFELRLADDPSARVALQVAIELVGAVAMATATPGDLSEGNSTRRRPRSRRFSGAVKGAAFALAAGLLLAVWIPGLGWQTRTIEVALAWVHLRDDPTHSESAPASVTEPTAAEAASLADLSLNDGDLAEIADIPAEQPLSSWILATVSAPDPETSASEGN